MSGDRGPGPRPVGDIYDEPWLDWTLRTAGTHLHPGREAATIYLAERAERFGFAVDGGPVLEVAPALGGPARFVARHFAVSVVGVDLNAAMLRRFRAAAAAEGLGARMVAVRGQAERLPLAGASLGGAWSQDAMCHMDRPVVVAEVARVLRPAALFVFSDWILRTELTAEDRADLDRTWGFPPLESVAGYVALLDRCGFDVLLAEDRSEALARSRRAGAPDDAEFERRFAGRWGEAELLRQKEPGEVWGRLAGAGKTGVGAFVARKRAR